MVLFLLLVDQYNHNQIIRFQAILTYINMLLTYNGSIYVSHMITEDWKSDISGPAVIMPFVLGIHQYYDIINTYHIHTRWIEQISHKIVKNISRYVFLVNCAFTYFCITII